MKNLNEKIKNFQKNNDEFRIYTTCNEWKNSGIEWSDDLEENDDYIYEVHFYENDIYVTCVPSEEFRNRVYNSDFSEGVTYVEEFFNELIQSQEIFEEF